MSLVKGILHILERLLLSPREEDEPGLPPPVSQAGTQSDAASKTLSVARTDVNALIPHDDKLLVFRALTGIDTVPALTRSGHTTRTAPNLGIYTRVIRAERLAAKGFRFYNLLINLFLGVQICVAAILTALGAANGPHAAVTGFGAINTIIAGAMTYLKGSGLPQRLKHHENEWRVVREYIEQREREFCLADCPLDVNEEILIVEEMYKTTKSELEAGTSQGAFKSSANDRPRSVLPSPSTAMVQKTNKSDLSDVPPTSEKPIKE